MLNQSFIVNNLLAAILIIQRTRVVLAQYSKSLCDVLYKSTPQSYPRTQTFEFAYIINFV